MELTDIEDVRPGFEEWFESFYCTVNRRESTKSVTKVV